MRELRAAYRRQLNESRFRGALAPPTLELVSTSATLGRWIPGTRTLEISRPLVVERPWGVVVEVLKHEMAHQYVHEILGETSETPHGPAFRDACGGLGVDARASGRLLAPRRHAPEENKIVERIARLLACWPESPNQHEAEAAMAAAQRLMLKYNLEVGVYPVRARLRLRAPRTADRSRGRARASGRDDSRQALLRRGHLDPRLSANGRQARQPPRNLRRAREPLHRRVRARIPLHETAQRFWREHKRARDIASDRERRAYLAGVMTGFAEKLRSQEVTSRSEGLVWVRDADLSIYFRRRHPNVRHVRYAGQRRTDAWARGREAGRTIVLHRPVTASAVSQGRLLPAKR